MTKVIVITCLLMLASTAYAESYLCTAQKVTGFDAYKGWEVSEFPTYDRKYIVRPVYETDSELDQGNKYLVRDEKEVHTRFVCKEGFSEKSDLGLDLPERLLQKHVGILRCGWATWSFSMNRNTLHYYAQSTGNWLDGWPLPHHDYGNPKIEIGKCKKL